MPLNSQISAEYDELTDLPTMMYFRRYAGTYVHRAHRLGRKAYLVFFNLKNFSDFNERYGFEEGDKLLRFTALVLSEEFPGYLLSRFSGDHFLLVCESQSMESRILDAREQIHTYGRHVNVELKAGIYTLENESIDIGLACDRAKSACDSIANRYDKVYRWFDEGLNWSLERSKYIESHIDRAINEGWIEVYYQPIVRSLSGEVCEFEALARWNDPHYGFLSPGVFIEVLENAHLIHKLDACIIRNVCAEWRKLRGTSKWRIATSLNLSRLDFELCDVFEMVDSLAREYDVPRQILHIEVTESALNQNNEQLLHTVHQLREAGYQVWLDDFGSGYSSLNTLKDYTFDVVKIDMAFLHDFDSKPQSRVIIASIVNMAKQLGMQTLIEGVETGEQFEFVRDIGCELVQGYLIGKPAPSSVNVKRILAGELVIEEPSLHGYYDRLGSINSLSATPFEFPWDEQSDEHSLADMLPLAIVEREAGEVRFVTANESFAKVLRDIGLGSLAQTAQHISEGETAHSRIVLGALQTAITSGRVESVDLLINGRHCVFRVRHIASHGTVDALLVSFLNLSLFSDMDEERRVKIAMRYLYTMYDEVHIVDLSTETINMVYRGNASYPTVAHDTKYQDAIDKFHNQFVHPKDRERYRTFMNMRTVAERVEGSDRYYLADAFRALGPDGLYSWITQVLVPIVYEGENSVLVCTRRTNDEILSTITGEEEIPKSLLWDTLLELVPAGVFWKDANRRFVGVNKNFLEFYSFESTNDVLGKNDEEMGWHVDTDPFKNNELRVLEGESVLNAQGTCISQGEVRHISASKIPLRNNGEVIGILGYFIDVTEDEGRSRSPISNGFNRMAETDHLTGLPNMRGLTSSAVAYQESFELNGVDFVYVVADIEGVSDLNGVYGRSFGNLVLKTVGRTITKAFGASAVVARVGGDKFAVLHQLDERQSAQSIVDVLTKTVSQIKEIAGITLRLHCFVGCALFSETGDLASTLALADERMNSYRQTGSV